MEFINLNCKNTLLLFMMLPLIALGYNQEFIWSRATYYGSPECRGNPTGACGYGEYGRTVNDGYVAGVHRPYRNGTGCGACYQVRCKGREYCRDEGVMVVATDFGVGDWTDFLFPIRAYTKMARPGYEASLLAHGIVHIEYRRVPCTFRGSNLIYSVHQHTKYPHYFAIIILYPHGYYDVVGAQIWQEDCKAWRPMRKPYGAVWDMENPPIGDLRIRFLLSASGSVNDATWVESPSIIPAYWQPDVTYQLAISF